MQGREWRAKVLELIRIRTSIPVAITGPLQMYEILAELRKQFPGEDWMEQEADGHYGAGDPDC